MRQVQKAGSRVSKDEKANQKALLEEKEPGPRVRLTKKEVTIFYKNESLPPIENVSFRGRGGEYICGRELSPITKYSLLSSKDGKS